VCRTRGALISFEFGQKWPGASRQRQTSCSTYLSAPTGAGTGPAPRSWTTSVFGVDCCAECHLSHLPHACPRARAHMPHAASSASRTPHSFCTPSLSRMAVLAANTLRLPSRAGARMAPPESVRMCAHVAVVHRDGPRRHTLCSSWGRALPPARAVRVDCAGRGWPCS